MIFVSVLDKMGHLGKDVIEELPVVVRDADHIAFVIEPVVDIAFPAIAPLYNMTVALVGNAESAAVAAGAHKAGKQKLALVLAALIPFAVQESANLGVAPPTVEQLSNWTNTVVAGLKALAAL
jgi:hypothetical protein